DLANLVNEAAIMAARRNKKIIGNDDLEESIDRVIAGPERKSRKISQKEKEITAYHEAGHALVGRMLPNADPIHKISIIARGAIGGYTKQLPAEDRYLHTRSYMKDMLAYALGGRAAEEIIFNEITDGAKSDIERATKLARAMVTDYGMSERLGPRTFGHKEEMVFLGREISEQRDYSEEVARMIDEEVQNIIETAHKTARTILTKNKKKLEHLAQELINRETLEGKDLEQIFSGLGLAKPTPKVKRTTIPALVKPIAEGEQVVKPKKVPGVPNLVPKQTTAD
ncbi:MAG: cell division protein FtsH, partial [Dehalococcoidales bacterium]|nr:cell division protein FtsH [Dehalococcoidales bacterium]